MMTCCPGVIGETSGNGVCGAATAAVPVIRASKPNPCVFMLCILLWVWIYWIYKLNDTVSYKILCENIVFSV